jgi:hemin uptake protein HemP
MNSSRKRNFAATAFRLCAAVVALAATGAAAQPLSAERIAGCNAEVKRLHSAWKHGRGDPRVTAGELGASQQLLFEGECAGHPQARAHITAARQMRVHAGDTAHASARETSKGGKMRSPTANETNEVQLVAAEHERVCEAPPRISSAMLLNGARTVEIAHNGEVYKLHCTKLGKLILTK